MNVYSFHTEVISHLWEWPGFVLKYFSENLGLHRWTSMVKNEWLLKPGDLGFVEFLLLCVFGNFHNKKYKNLDFSQQA